jgi:Uma2 family endonuclease
MDRQSQNVSPLRVTRAPHISRKFASDAEEVKVSEVQTRSARNLISEEEYLALEQVSEVRHEFYEGEVFAMAGGNPEHALATTNLSSALNAALRSRGCRVYSPDLRVKVEASGLQTYPDVTVLCEAPKYTADKPPALTNPPLIAEVLSESTEAYDRGTKFHHYCRIPSLTTYILVSQSAPTVELLVRKAEFQWEHQVISGLDSLVEVPTLGIAVALRDIFAGIDFPPAQLRSPQAGTIGSIG